MVEYTLLLAFVALAAGALTSPSATTSARSEQGPERHHQRQRGCALRKRAFCWRHGECLFLGMIVAGYSSSFIR